MCSVVMTGFVIMSPVKSSPLKKILQFLAQNLFVEQRGKNCSKIDVTKCLSKCKVISSSKTQVTYLQLDFFSTSLHVLLRKPLSISTDRGRKDRK